MNSTPQLHTHKYTNTHTHTRAITRTVEFYSQQHSRNWLHWKHEIMWRLIICTRINGKKEQKRAQVWLLLWILKFTLIKFTASGADTIKQMGCTCNYLFFNHPNVSYLQVTFLQNQRSGNYQTPEQISLLEELDTILAVDSKLVWKAICMNNLPMSILLMPDKVENG